MFKHFKEAHTEAFEATKGLLPGKESILRNPIVVETKGFWLCLQSQWKCKDLGRLQRDDGSWTDYFGYHLDFILEAGFHPWTQVSANALQNLMKQHGDRVSSDLTKHSVLANDVPNLSLKAAGQKFLDDERMRQEDAGASNPAETMAASSFNETFHVDSRLSSKVSASLLNTSSAGQETSLTLQHDTNNVSDASLTPDLYGTVTAWQRTNSIAGMELEVQIGTASSPPSSNTSYALANAQPDSLPGVRVEATFAAFDWDAFLNTDLNAGFDSNNLALNNNEMQAFDFDDLDSIPGWYFDVEDSSGPGF